jgi:hypothetical protein
MSGTPPQWVGALGTQALRRKTLPEKILPGACVAMFVKSRIEEASRVPHPALPLNATSHPVGVIS